LEHDLEKQIVKLRFVVSAYEMSLGSDFHAGPILQFIYLTKLKMKVPVIFL